MLAKPTTCAAAAAAATAAAVGGSGSGGGDAGRSTLDVSLAEILSAHVSTTCNYEYRTVMIVVRIEAASVADVTRR